MVGGELALAAGPPSSGLPDAVVRGLVTGSVVAIGAIGLSLVYSIAEVPNFAHGELLTLGAYLAFLVNRPSVVPLYDVFVTGEGVVSTAGLAVLFALSTAAVLGVVRHLGGENALAGDWWSREVSPATGYAVHVGLAVAFGAVVVASTPSVFGGMLFSAVGLAAVAPVFEERVFNKFRERGDDLATLLIVALGLSFVLRFGVQAFYGGQVRAYDIPDVASLAGVELPLSAVQNVNVYGVDGGVVVQVVDTLPDPAVTTVVVGYGPVALAALAVVPLAAALAGYRWRGGSDDVFTSGQTVGPKLTAALAWLVATGVLVATLAGDATVPERYAWGTQLSPSVKRLSTLVIAAGMLTVLHLLLNETKLGVAMRAASDNLDLAKVTGINTRRVIVAAWIIAGLFSAIAGVMIGILFTSITPNTGFFFLLPIFGGVILGGVDSVYGAVLGSYVVGLSMELGIFFLPISGTLRVPVAFVVLLVVLLVKPEGLLGGS